jgi:hypothetical protein
MNELDEAWSQIIAAAIHDANASGRGDVADYLALKKSNDLIRQASVQWLFDSLIEIASDASRHQPAIIIEREDPHEFPFQNSMMAGSLLRVRSGVRRMTLEAGWTRTPTHGFMRNGALAAARISHFGIPTAGVELILLRKDEMPVWNVIEAGPFDSVELSRQFAVFLGT